MSQRQLNDEDRRQWVENDEGLWDLWRTSGQAKRQWIRENRKLIDEVVNKVVGGTKPAHYLKYRG